MSAHIPVGTIAILCAGYLSGCEEPTAVVHQAPVIQELTVRSNEMNALSAIVVVRSTGGVLARVEAISSDGIAIGSPEVSITPDSTVIPLLLLRPETSYSIRVVVSDAVSTVSSENFQFTTSRLPPELPDFRLIVSSGPDPGFVMTGITSPEPSPRCYAIILDNDATIVWYRGFDVPVTDFQKLPNGSFSVYASPDGGPSRFLEIDLLGNVIAEYAALAPAETGPHELRISNEARVLFGVEFRTLDLTAIGGMPQASVRGINIEGFTRSARDFFWTTFDHFAVNDASADIVLTGATVNPWHGNAIELDGEDHLLVSFRNMDEITKIDRRTGQVVWRLGGKQNEFMFIGDGLNGFSHQHGIRRLENGNIILFDNGNLHVPPQSRAVEYLLSEDAKTATLVWEYRGAPELFSFALGFAQRLPSGNTLICFGISQHIVEVDRLGQKKWEIVLDRPNYYPYRAFRIESVY